MDDVNSDRPRVTMAGAGALYSAVITMVGLPSQLRGSWLAAAFSPRVTISRRCAPWVMPLAASVRSISAVSASRVSPMSRASFSSPA